MIPICLITGFLGTGKTTLLKRIVEQNRDQKWIYLINEFSALDVDGSIVSANNANVISIPGGSIFCKCLVSEFIGQLTKIYQHHGDAEGVIIEASGMADPRVIADMLNETGLNKQFQLSNIVTIVEPRSFLRLIHTLPNIIHQVESADWVLLNKCDLFDAEKVEETERAVLEIKADAHVLRCMNSEGVFSVFNPSPAHVDLHGEYAKCRDPRYAAFAIRLAHEVDPAKYAHLIESNEVSIYRVKGYLQTTDGPIYFDYSKAALSITPAKNQAEYGLAWICIGDDAAHIESLALAL